MPAPRVIFIVDRDLAVRDSAADRSADAGELDVERTLLDPSLGRREGSAGGLHLSGKLVDIGLRYRVRFEQAAGAA